MGSCSAQEPHCVLSLASESESQNTGWVRACACGCGGRVMAYTGRLHLKNQERCHPIGFGFERVDSKIGYMYRICSDDN